MLILCFKKEKTLEDPMQFKDIERTLILVTRECLLKPIVKMIRHLILQDWVP